MAQMAKLVRVSPDSGPPVTLLPGGSRITDEELSEDLIEMVLARLREENRRAPARAVSRAITQCQDAWLWIKALREGKIR